MSSSRKGCSCKRNRCNNCNCRCFRDRVPCLGGKCGCKDCENNKVESEQDAPRRVVCTCMLSRCLQRACVCFKANLLCSAGNCKCVDCRNNEKNKDGVESQHNKYNKRKAGPDAKLVNGCSCRLSSCLNLQCSCYANDVKCSSKCICQDCSNGEEPGGSNKNTEPGQGSADGVSNIPDSNKRARTSCH